VCVAADAKRKKEEDKAKKAITAAKKFQKE